MCFIFCPIVFLSRLLEGFLLTSSWGPHSGQQPLQASSMAFLPSFLGANLRLCGLSRSWRCCVYVKMIPFLPLHHMKSPFIDGVVDERELTIEKG
jgi:hypothetical protein